MRAKCWNEASERKISEGQDTCEWWQAGYWGTTYEKCHNCAWHGFDGKWLTKTIRDHQAQREEIT
jgi:hypothetical protein